MPDQIQILLAGKLNSKITEANINADIKKLESKLQKINLKIDVDQKVLATLSNFSKSMENLTVATQKQNRIIEENIRITKGLDGTTTKIATTTKANGDVVTKTTNTIKEQNEILKKTDTSLKNVTKSTLGVTDASHKSQQSITGMIAKFSSWLVIGTLVMQPVRAFQDMIKTLTEVDTALVEINKVLDLNKSQLSGLTQEATQLGIAYGRTTTEVLKSIGAFAKAGLDKQASKQMAELAALLSNVGDMTTEMAEETLIATNAGYQMGNDYQRLNLLISQFNELANKNAIEVDTLADAWMNSASMAKQSKLEIEQYNALITVSGSATQKSGKEIGNAWKTVLMRLQGVSDGVDTLDEDVGKAEEALNSIGIAVRKTPTEWRPAMEVLEEFAKKYKELGEQGRTVEQSYVTEALAGKYRANILAATLQNFDQIKKALQDQVGALGSAEAENARYMDSITARAKALRATWEQMTINLINSDWVKSFVSGLQSFVEWIDKANVVAPALAGIVGGLLTTAIISLNGGIKALNVELIKTNLLTAGIPVMIGLLVTGLTALSISAFKTRDEFNKLNNEQEKLIDTYKSQIDSANKNVSAKEGEAKVAETLAKKIEELTAKESLNVAEKAQMKSIVGELNQLMPDLNLQIDSQTGKIIGNTSAIWDNIEALKAQAIAQGYQAKASAAGNAYANQETLLGETKRKLDQAEKELSELQNNQTSSSGYGTSYEKNPQADLIKKIVEVKNLRDLVKEQTDNLEKYDADIENYTEQALKYKPKTTTSTNKPSSSSGKSSTYIPPSSGSKKETQISDILTKEQFYQNSLIDAQNKSKNLLSEEYDLRLANLNLEEQAQKNLLNYYESQRAVAKSKGLEDELNEKILKVQGDLADIEKTRKELNNQILEAQKKQAEEAIKISNEALKSQLDGLNELMESEEEAHQDRLDKIEKEKKKWDDYIDDKIEGIERAKEAEDYNNDVNDITSEINKLQAERNKYALAAQSGDLEAQAKITELDEQISEKQKDLAETQADREYELRKENLEDMKDKKDEEYEKAKETENKKYDAIKDTYDKLKSDIDNFTQAGINANATMVDSILEQFNNLNSQFSPIVQNMANIFGSTFIAKLQQAKSQLMQLQAQLGMNNKTGLDEVSTIAQMKANSEEWKTASAGRKQELEAINYELGSGMGWTRGEDGYWYKPDGTRAYAKGTPDVRKELSLVGENGRELMALNPNGTKSIIPNSVTESLLNFAKNPANFLTNIMTNINKPMPITSAGVGAGGFSMGNININVNGSITDANVDRVSKSIKTELKDVFTKAGIISR